MLCQGEGYSWEVDKAIPDNTEIIRAFLPSRDLSVHCIINTNERELFVLADSCRHAKIISVYHQHLQAVGCGRCSGRDLQEFLRTGPQFFGEKLEAAIEKGEPGILWSPAYVSEELSRLGKLRMEQLLAARFSGQ